MATQSTQCRGNDLINIQNTNENSLILSNHKLVEEEETYIYADQIVDSLTLPMVLKAIIDMGVLKIIHDHAGAGGLSPTEIAAQIQTQNPDAPGMLDRLLRLLANHSVVSCTAVVNANNGGTERRYGASPVSKYYVPDEDGVSLAPMLNLVLDKVFLQTWSKLKEAVMDGGIPFDKVHGMPVFDYPSVDVRFNKVFNKAMYDHSTRTMKKILETYKGFDNIKQLVDVGGGLGHNLCVITTKYPSMKGINFDLPHVIQHAPHYPSVEHIGGSMFESIPRGDAIFLKWILHNWSDDHCLKMLKNCYKALPNKGKMIVVESIIADEAETTTCAKSVSQMDVLMMTFMQGGKERTIYEFESLAKAAGFSGVRLDSCVARFWIMEFLK